MTPSLKNRIQRVKKREAKWKQKLVDDPILAAVYHAVDRAATSGWVSRGPDTRKLAQNAVRKIKKHIHD